MKTIKDLNYSHLVLFDGECPFCNGWMLKLARLDSKDEFLFVAAKSEEGQGVLTSYKLENITEKSVVVIINKTPYLKLNAVYHYFKFLKRRRILRFFIHLTPPIMANFIYDKIAQHRMKFRKQKCIIPTDHLKSKFIF